MNVLIYGAGNSIAISTAICLSKAGHNPILADTRRHVRGFYSRYCKGKYIFRGPDGDERGFASDLNDCLRKEKVELILPTYDDALFHLMGAKNSIPDDVQVTFPMDHEKIRYVMDKKNIPSTCSRAGIDAIPTYSITGNFDISSMERIVPPYVLKLGYGVSGKGFMKVNTLQELKKELSRIRREGMEDRYLLQKYISGAVYGAIGVFQDNALKCFSSYRYIRRYPPLAGNPTICAVDHKEGIRSAMSKVLATLQWEGFCQMDFIIEDNSGIPYLSDINPVHWYSVPNSLSERFNCLTHYIGREEGKKVLKGGKGDFYTTISAIREMQRIVTGREFRKGAPDGIGYWSRLQGIQGSDFYWDPLPVVLAPLLKLLRYSEKRVAAWQKGRKRVCSI